MNSHRFCVLVTTEYSGQPPLHVPQQPAFHFAPPQQTYPYSNTPRMGANFDPRAKSSFSQARPGNPVVTNMPPAA